jgi:hypothetical protein
MGLYLSLIKSGEYSNGINELKRYLEIYPADMYRDTLEELMGDINDGFAWKYKDIILELAVKNGTKQM